MTTKNTITTNTATTTLGPFPRNPHALKPEEVATLIELAETLGASRRNVRVALDNGPNEARVKFIDLTGRFVDRLWAIEDVRVRLAPVLAHRAIVAERQRELEAAQQAAKPATDLARKARRAAKQALKQKPKLAPAPKPATTPKPKPSGPRSLPPMLSKGPEVYVTRRAVRA